MHVLVVSTSRRSARHDVLVTSLSAAHPEADVTTLWCDARLTSVPGAGVLCAAEIDLGDLRWADLALALGERSAGWAAVPWVAQHLVATDVVASGPLVVLDDTFVVLDRLDDLVAADQALVRSRHVDRVTRLGWGGPLPGALVVPGVDVDLLDWWRERVIDELDHGDPVLEPWWSSVAGLRQSTDPRFRLAPSTADEVDLQIGSDGEPLTATGAPALVDFDGFDPTAPWWFAPEGGDPLRSPSESPGLRALCRAHARRLLEAGWTAAQDHDAAELASGVVATDELRAWFLELWRERDPESPPNPYVPGEVAEFLEVLGGPGRSDGTGVSAVADQIYGRRPDLRAAFPHPRWRDRDSFRRWIWTSGPADGEITLPLLPEPPRPTPRVVVTGERRPFGVNLVGYLDAELGLGVAARQMRRALEVAGVPTSSVSYDRTASARRTGAPGTTDRPYHFNLMLIVPDQLPLFVTDVGPGFLEGHHNIGLWYWESDVLTDHQKSAFEFVDEVWAATEYLRAAFASAQVAPVSLVPSPLVFPTPDATADRRRRLGLDDRFTFLFSFDFLSVVDRKNPLGLVEAYTRAFGPDDGTRLVLKSINGHIFPFERERVAEAIADRPDIDLRDLLLSSEDRIALVAEADCYVSLHRSEGLGLTMAEAMAAGTPVVATAYSGNLDFMDEDSALLVPAKELRVGPGHYYPPEGHWADPDLDAAAAAMRRVRDDAQLRERLGVEGPRSIARFGYEQVGRVAKDRLLESWRSGQSR